MDISSSDIGEYLSIGHIYSYDNPGKDPIAYMEKTPYGMVIYWSYRNGFTTYGVEQKLNAPTSAISFTIPKNNYLIFDH